MQQEQKFKIGDVVFSPKENCYMSVREYKNNQVVCNWFTKNENGDYQLYEESFEESMLSPDLTKID